MLAPHNIALKATAEDPCDKTYMEPPVPVAGMREFSGYYRVAEIKMTTVWMTIKLGTLRSWAFPPEHPGAPQGCILQGGKLRKAAELMVAVDSSLSPALRLFFMHLHETLLVE